MPATRSGTPQLEDGFTKLADELLEALCRAHLCGREMAVALAVIRLTYGWQKKKDRIAASQIAKLTGIPSVKIPPLLRALEAKGVVRIEKSGQGQIPTLSIKKDHRRWSKRGVTTGRRVSPPEGGSTSNSAQLAPKLGRTSPLQGGGSSPLEGVSVKNQLPPYRVATSPQEGGGTSPLEGGYHRQIDNTKERALRFGELKPRLSPKKVAALQAIRPGGVLYPADQIQAWFLASEPIMKARGYKSTVRCAVNWFRRVKPEEIRRAVMWVETQALEGLRHIEDDRDRDPLAAFKSAFEL